MEVAGGTKTQFLWHGLSLVAEYRDSVLSAQYVHAESPDHLVQIAARGNQPGIDGSEHWYHTDLVGSVRLLTTWAGNDAARYGYEPFGKVREAPPDEPYNPFLFSGKRFDKTLDTYDFHLRQYDPLLSLQLPLRRSYC